MSPAGPDVIPQATRRNHTSRWKTWCRLSAKPALPLTKEKLMAVTSELKRRGYRSTANFLSSAKRYHIATGFRWSASLMQTFTDCRRCAVRRLGPPRRARAFRWARLSLLPAAVDSRPATLLRLPVHALALGSHFLLRTIELGALQMQHVFIRPAVESAGPGERGTVTFTIVCSKMDYASTGFRIRHSCTCSGPGVGEAIPVWCPFHLAVHYAESCHGSLGPWPLDERKFFLTVSGAVATPALVAGDLRKLDADHGIAEDAEDEPVIAGRQPPSWGGHSLRRTGAREYFRLGLPKPQLYGLGRWNGPAIDGYIHGLPFVLNVPRNPLVSSCTRTDLQFAALSQKVSRLEGHLQRANLSATPVTDSHSRLVFVLSLPSGQETRSKLHKVSQEGLLSRASTWKTQCGFKFGCMQRDFRLLSAIGGEAVRSTRCEKCFRVDCP